MFTALFYMCFDWFGECALACVSLSLLAKRKCEDKVKSEFYANFAVGITSLWFMSCKPFLLIYIIRCSVRSAINMLNN